MKFLGIDALKAEISGGSLEQRDIFKYWLATYLLIILVAFPVSEDPSVWVHLYWAASSVINILMLRKCYLANGGASGVQFSDKFLSICWVVSVRGFLFVFLPLLVVGTLVVGVAGAIVGLGEAGIKTLVENCGLVELLIYLLWVWLRTASHIRDVR